MNLVLIVSIVGMLALGWWLLRRSPILGGLALGTGIVSAVAAFGLTGFVTSIPPALGRILVSPLATITVSEVRRFIHSPECTPVTEA